MKKPSFANLKENFSLRNAKKLGLFLLTASTIIDGGLLYNYAPTNKFTLKSTLGVVDNKTTPSGLYFHLPFVQYVHDYHKTVQTIDFNAGGMRFLPLGENTADHNHLNAEIKLNYRVSEDAKKLGFHPWAMDGYLLPDGYWLLTEKMNESDNAVMGQRSMAETVANPERFLKEFNDDLKFRLEQNNIPVEVESIELQNFKTFLPAKVVSNQKIINPHTTKPSL